MRFKNSAGRWRSRESSEIARIVGRVRAWRHAGIKYATAQDILDDIHQIQAKFPRLTRRLDCVESYLTNVILDTIVGVAL